MPQHIAAPARCAVGSTCLTPLCKPNTTNELHANTIRRVGRCCKTRKKSRNACPIASVPSTTSTAASANDTFGVRNEHQGSPRPTPSFLVVRGSAFDARRQKCAETTSALPAPSLWHGGSERPRTHSPRRPSKAARKRSDPRIIVRRISALKSRRAKCAADPVKTRLAAIRWNRFWGHGLRTFCHWNEPRHARLRPII